MLARALSSDSCSVPFKRTAETCICDLCPHVLSFTGNAFPYSLHFSFVLFTLISQNKQETSYIGLIVKCKVIGTSFPFLGK